MIEHMKHNSLSTMGYNQSLTVQLDKYDAKINELIRVVNILQDDFACYRNEHLSPAKKKKLEKINLLKKQLKQLEMEL